MRGVLLLQPCRCRIYTCVLEGRTRVATACGNGYLRERENVRRARMERRIRLEAAGCECEKHVEMRAAGADERKSTVPRVSRLRWWA